VPGSGTATPPVKIPQNGYLNIQFTGKKAQAARVQQLVTENGFVPKELVAAECMWFYDVCPFSLFLLSLARASV